MKELRLEAKAENLSKVIALVNEELKNNNFTDEFISEIEIAVEEIFINIANYAYEPGSGDAVVSVSASGKTTIRFEDTGRPYNPLTHAEPDLEKPPVEREIGGLGIFMVKKIMDKVEYSRVNDRNILVITKELPAS